jgi:hypothetical protein
MTVYRVVGVGNRIDMTVYRVFGVDDKTNYGDSSYLQIRDTLS